MELKEKQIRRSNCHTEQGSPLPGHIQNLIVSAQRKLCKVRGS